MRSFMFCTSYLPNPYVETYNERYRQWIAYYGRRLRFFGAERLFLVDDGSPLDAVRLEARIVAAGEEQGDPGLPAGPVMLRFPVHLGRSSIQDFPGWWRSFSFAALAARRYGFEKIIHVESDAYVLSPRMADYIAQLRTGWTAFWCRGQGFPETAIQVICGACIDSLATFYRRGAAFWFKARRANEIPEGVLPFTSVCKAFQGDRYGECDGRIPADADYACQVGNAMRLSETAVLWDHSV